MDFYFHNDVQFQVVSFKSEINTTILRENVSMNDFAHIRTFDFYEFSTCES
jgi:hypothetical protein